MSAPFSRGNRVNKVDGYKFSGVVLACYLKRDEKTWRVDVENDDGMIHVFAPEQLIIARSMEWPSLLVQITGAQRECALKAFDDKRNARIVEGKPVDVLDALIVAFGGAK